jgi:hypothetical protein
MQVPFGLVNVTVSNLIFIEQLDEQDVVLSPFRDLDLLLKTTFLWKKL